MAVLRELFHDVFGHGEIHIMFVVIPFKVDAAVEVTCTIFDDFVCFFADGIIKVLEVFFANVLDAEVINCMVEPDRASLVLPKSRGVWLFVVSVFGEVLFEELVGKNAILCEAVHSFPTFHGDISLKGFLK